MATDTAQIVWNPSPKTFYQALTARFLGGLLAIRHSLRPRTVDKPPGSG